LALTAKRNPQEARVLLKNLICAGYTLDDATASVISKVHKDTKDTADKWLQLIETTKSEMRAGFEGADDEDLQMGDLGIYESLTHSPQAPV